MLDFNDFFGVVSSSTGSGQSEVTRYICCMFEAEFFISGAIKYFKSAILFSHANVASDNNSS